MSEKIKGLQAEKNVLESKLKKLANEEHKIEKRLHVLSFLDQIEHVKDHFENDYNGYTVIIEKGDTFDIRTKLNSEMLRHEVVFVIPKEYTSKIIEIIESAAIDEMNKQL